MQASQGREYLQAALEGIEQGLERLGPAIQLQLRALDLEVELERFDAALARLDSLAQGARRQESQLARRGAILRSAGRSLEALEAYRSAREALGRLSRKQRGTRMMAELAQEVDRCIHALERDRINGPPGNQE